MVDRCLEDDLKASASSSTEEYCRLEKQLQRDSEKHAYRHEEQLVVGKDFSADIGKKTKELKVKLQ